MLCSKQKNSATHLCYRLALLVVCELQHILERRWYWGIFIIGSCAEIYIGIRFYKHISYCQYCTDNECCFHRKFVFRSWGRGRQKCGIIHYNWWIASIKPMLLFPYTSYASCGLSLFLRLIINKSIYFFK